MKFMELSDSEKYVLNFLLGTIKKGKTETNLSLIIQVILGDDIKAKSAAIAELQNVVGQKPSSDKKYAIFLLGFCYRWVLDAGNRDEIKKNNEEAFKLFSLFAKTSPLAQNELGLMFELGKGVTKDSKQSLSLYASAAKEAYAPAIHNLAKTHDTGDKSTQDLKRAAALYQQAMNHGYLKSQCNYALLLMVGGQDFVKDEELGRKLLKEAAEKGSNKARDELKKLYAKDLEGIFSSLEKVTSLDKKDLEEQGKLRCCENIVKNNQEIITALDRLEELKVAAETLKIYKDRLSKAILSIFDKFESFDWKNELVLQLDKLNTHPKSNLLALLYARLAKCLEEGLGGSVNDSESIRCYKKAAELGDIEAKQKAEEIVKKMAEREAKAIQEEQQKTFIPKFVAEQNLTSELVKDEASKIDENVEDYTVTEDGVRFHS